MSPTSAAFLGISLLSASVAAATQEQAVGEFSSVQISSGIHATVEIGPRRPVRIEADDQVLQAVELRVEGDELHVGFRPGTRWTGEHRVQVTIQTPQLRAVGGSGGSEVRASFNRGSDAEISASGGSVMNVRGVDAARLGVHGSGGSVINLSGSADSLSLHLSGGSELHGRDLSVKDIDVQGSGGSQGELRADGRVRGSLSGGSGLHIRGRATTRVATSGGSEVNVQD
ncbi:MAG TPA: DUF2807 domain-containing protein [Myxococcales bacterium]|jgi:hypothetical protein|nr:DUF2807 domain-containing protein [Myxococcales bacterium]